MKWMIASDLHGSYYYAQQLQQAFEREQADRLLFLGDLLYHGPRNDLPRDYAPKKVIPLLNSLAPKLLCVRGNCDAEVDQMVLNFPVLADYAVLPMGQRLVYVTHGHVFNLNHLPPLAPGDILLHGHTHVPAWTNFGQGNLYLNPGSVSIPKENTAHSYMTMEGGNNTYIQSEGINQDFGIYNSPDELLTEHHQEMSIVKAFAYRHFGRHLMNKNVKRIRDAKV